MNIGGIEHPHNRWWKYLFRFFAEDCYTCANPPSWAPMWIGDDRFPGRYTR